jgi:hypothetical protein
LRRIFEGKYEPLEDGWLVVRVRANELKREELK